MIWMKYQAKTINIHHLFTERPHSVTSPTERWRTCGLVTQLILSPLAKWPHLPSNQWEEQNSQRPPISCVVVRSPAQNLWGCTAEGARACMREMHRIYMHWCFWTAKWICRCKRELGSFSPIYWMVPQMVNALPPLSKRRDKPKSARRRCPRTNHLWFCLLMQFLLVSCTETSPS